MPRAGNISGKTVRQGERKNMTKYQLRSTQNHAVLFEGEFTSFRACLERAIYLKLNLDHIDLRHQNLSNASLDEARMHGADFTGANLSGANISEARLAGARFTGAALYNTCLALSDLAGCDFENASFGATDVFGAVLSHARFSTLSCFTLDFTRVQAMQGCVFINPDGRVSRMSRPPVVIQGLSVSPVVMMDEDVRAGQNLIDRARIERMGRRLAARELRKRLGAAAKIHN